MRGQINAAAHAALQYIISRAALQGKVGSTVIELPLTDLFNEFEGLQFEPDAAELVLRIKITTEWAEGEPELQEFELDEDTEEEDTDGTDSDKTGTH